MLAKRYLPILNWAKNYPKSALSGDISAGITVGIMLIPQGMAYAGIAGLPPVYGLYAAIIPQLVYAILGTSRQLAVGPVAMDSLLVAAGVSAMATIGTEKYIALAILLAFMMGAIQFLFGVFRLGFLVNFLSKPVISGFTSGAAIIIAMSQLKHLTGINLSSSSHLHTLLLETFSKINELHLLTLVIGLGAIAIIKLIKKFNKSIPGALVVVVLGIFIVYLGNLSAYGIKIVKEVPQGLPHFQIPLLEWQDIQKLLPTAFALALIAFMEAISVAKAIHAKHRNYELDANQELIALGGANLIGSFFQCYPTTGGFSRTAVNHQAGAKTNLAAIISAIIVGITLLFLTPLFYHLPQAVLAAIIMVAVLALIDVKYPVALWKNQKDEFWLLLITFLITLTIGIQQGILIGLVFSLAIMIYRTMHPHVAILGKLPAFDEYRNINRFPNVEIRKDVLIMRYDADIYFANVGHFRDTLKDLMEEKGEDLNVIILNMNSINRIDSTALFILEDIYNELQSIGVLLYLAGVKGPVRDTLHKTGLAAKFKGESFFMDESHAIAYYDHKVEENVRERLQSIAFQTNANKI